MGGQLPRNRPTSGESGLTALTIRQRAKVNAALALIHDSGHSANAVTQAARNHMARGHDPRRSFELALNDFAKGKPELGSQLEKATRLIEASDDATVARYDAALSSYIQTGDASGIEAITPMVIQDSIALAFRNGELAPEDATGPNAFGIAMGHSPDTAMSDRQASSTPVAASPPAPAQRASFTFGQQSPVNDRQAAGASVRAPMSAEREKAWAGVPTGSAGVRTASGGYRAPMTGERAARWYGVPLASEAGKEAMAADGASAA